jgi:Tol biopolymer transport system component
MGTRSRGLTGKRWPAASGLWLLAVVGGTGCIDFLAPAYRITTTGYVERGATLTLALYDRGARVPPGEVSWSASPAGAVTIQPGPNAVLVDTGAILISARYGSATTTMALHVAVPPAIAFDLQDSGGLGNRDVYRETLDGQGLVQLTSGTGDNEQPTVADSTIVFTSYRNGYAALYTVATSGGTSTLLSAAPAPASQAALSADGTRLAFISPSGGIDHLWTAAADGSGAALATGSAGFATALQASPTWAPAGDTVAVVSTEFGNAALVDVAIAAGVETPLTNGATTDLSPAWSPDGTTIAFASTRDGDLGIFLLTVSTDVVTRLTPSPATDGEPTWLRDGRIVYTSGTGAATQLRWIDPAHPDTGHVIPTPVGGNPQHPVAIGS